MHTFPRARPAQRAKSLVRARQRGVTMVEFAIVMPFALLLVLGLIQIGLMYSAKSIVNEAAFMAARAGAVQNAQRDKMIEAMQRALVPLYQDTTNPDPASRLSNALQQVVDDTQCSSPDKCLTVQILNPTPEAFADFGITSGAVSGTFIPNDNLEFRSHSVRGRTSGLSIQDANTLKIKVTYGYQLKVPLINVLFGAILCAWDGHADADSHVDAFGRANSPLELQGDNDCTTFYDHGKTPIVAYATVQMQTPAVQQ